MSGKVVPVLFLVLLVRLGSSVSLLEMYPFGQQYGHQAMPRNDDRGSPEIPISTAFTFSNTAYSSLYVSYYKMNYFFAYSFWTEKYSFEKLYERTVCAFQD